MNRLQDFLGTRRTEIFMTDPTQSNVFESCNHILRNEKVQEGLYDYVIMMMLGLGWVGLGGLGG